MTTSTTQYNVDPFTRSYGADRITHMLAERHGDRYRAYRDAWNRAGQSWYPDYPLNLIFDLVDRCNQACPQCLRAPDLIKGYDGFLGTRRMLSYETVEAILDESAAHGLPSVNIGGSGEGTLHPDIIRICRKIMESGVVEFRLITNGLRLNRELAEALIDLQVHIVSVSIDGFSPDSYAISRGNARQYQPVVDNVLAFAALKRERKSDWPLLRVSFVNQDGNKHEAGDFVQFWSQHADMVDLQSYSDYRQQDGFESSFDCAQPFQRLMVWAYGGAGPCCGFPGIVYNIGDYRTRRIRDIWHGPEMNAMRRMMTTKAYERPCLQCRGTRTVV